MARISTYTIDGSIDGTEFVLGREADGTTKQFSMSALQTYLATTISPTTVFASIDVNGGTIDGTVIGGSSAAAGSFTTISASSNATITGNATVGGTLGVTGVTTLVDANVTGELNFDGSAGTAGYYLKSSGDGVTPVWDQLSLNDLSDVLIEDNSIYVGNDPSSTTSTAQYNVAVGATALDAVTTGDSNIAIGYNTLGSCQTSTGNVAIGHDVMNAVTTSNTQAVAIGYTAGKAITTGLFNVLVGYEAGVSLTTGQSNVAVGHNALRSATTGTSNNIAIGLNALYNHQANEDSDNVAVGYRAGQSVTTGQENILIGSDAAYNTTTGLYNVAIGHNALFTNVDGDGTVAIGHEALYTMEPADGLSHNTAVGYRAGKTTTTGTSLTYLGSTAGQSNLAGSDNTGIGRGALTDTTTGGNNTAVGSRALTANIDGSKAVAVGSLSLQNQEPSGATDTYNVGVGYNSGGGITTGVQNTVVGSLAGDAVTTGSGNTAIGYNTSFSAVGASNQTVIGSGAAGQGDNIVVIGNSSITNINPGNAGVALGSTTNPYQDIFVSRNIKASTNSQDLGITQFDGNEVARVHDGGTTQSDTDMTAVGHGFGYKKPIMSVTADAGDKTVTLTNAESGSIIHCDADTNNIIFNLPEITVASKAGLTYTFVNTTAVNGSKTVEIKTNGAGTDNNDNFLMYGFSGATSISDVVGDTLKIPNSAAIGTVVRITCLASGASNAAEIWLAEVFGASTVTNVV